MKINIAKGLKTKTELRVVNSRLDVALNTR